MVAKCISCKQNVSRNNPGILCNGCDKHFHAKCGKIDKELFHKLASGEISVWKCESCRIQLTTHNLNNTSLNMGETDFESDIDFHQSIKKIHMELEKIKATQLAFTNSVCKVSKQLSVIESMATAISDNKKRIDDLESENTQLKHQIVSQHQRIHQLEQKEAQKQIMIYNIPNHEPNIDLRAVFTQVQAVLSNVPLKDDDVVDIRRLPSKTAKPGPLLIEMKNTHVCKRFLTAAKLHRINVSQNQNSLSFSISNSINDQLIYINEYIPISDLILYKKAKAHKIEHNFKYLWKKNGNIFTRKDDESKIFKLSSLTDFDRVKL
ncbi:uncharacterized protein LOC129945123 [Eupeodes corollae]|uniref:uncharacterized protein LOC129945123 n=1 Tax=Eupeodes corollae TaxID=290404 RepID=UPI0024936D7E|nr:uncharacterized protein LOC129945123 [Eupeodes corollae]